MCNKIELEEYAEYINRLKKLNGLWDQEAAHGEADDILCELLTKLGYSEVVKAYEEVDKWYA